MPGIRDVIIAKEENERAIGAVDNADIIFFLDFNRIDRLENLSRHIIDNRKAVRILIDHHLDRRRTNIHWYSPTPPLVPPPTWSTR